MTAKQEEQIRVLRAKGVGYRSIGTIVHLSRDSVRNYCRTHNLNGPQEVVRLNIKRMQEDKSVCTYCGVPIKQNHTGRPKRFCSERCRMKWWKQHRDEIKKDPEYVYEFNCRYCGKPFTAYGNKKRVYCCHECYVKDRFWSPIEDFEEDDDRLFYEEVAHGVS